jgi:hypothetical protein
LVNFDVLDESYVPFREGVAMYFIATVYNGTFRKAMSILICSILSLRQPGLRGPNRGAASGLIYGP